MILGYRKLTTLPAASQDDTKRQVVDDKQINRTAASRDWRWERPWRACYGLFSSALLLMTGTIGASVMADNRDSAAIMITYSMEKAQGTIHQRQRHAIRSQPLRVFARRGSTSSGSPATFKQLAPSYASSSAQRCLFGTRQQLACNKNQRLVWFLAQEFRYQTEQHGHL